jgi:pyrroline-5-carboxylate reductase
MPTIGFIGGGNMASSLIGGLINAGVSASAITVSEPETNRNQALKTQFQINTVTDNNQLMDCEIIVFAVKPQLLKTVCQQLETTEENSPLFISIAAGIRSTDINRWLKSNQTTNDLSQDNAIVRCMPNTPALVQTGASGLFASLEVNEEQKTQASQIMEAVGIVVWVDKEEQLDAVTAISGSGPAYYFLMMEAMQQAGEKLGLTAETANKLVLQTALGASRMAMESTESTTILRQQVTSKGGTTEQAILSFQSADFNQIVWNALKAANDRSISLANELGSTK